MLMVYIPRYTGYIASIDGLSLLVVLSPSLGTILGTNSSILRELLCSSLGKNNVISPLYF